MVAAGRNRVALEAAYTDTTVSVKYVDVTDDTSIAAPADEVGSVHHVVSTVSARARGAVAELSPEAIPLSFHTKVMGPIMPAQTLRSEDAEDGSFVLFSGVATLEPDPGFLTVAATNGSVNAATRSLAVY